MVAVPQPAQASLPPTKMRAVPPPSERATRDKTMAALAAALVLLASSGATGTAPQVAWRSTVQQGGHGGYQCYNAPSIVSHPTCAAEAGAAATEPVLIAFLEARKQCHDHGVWMDLVSYRSLDGGRRWSSPRGRPRRGRAAAPPAAGTRARTRAAGGTARPAACPGRAARPARARTPATTIIEPSNRAATNDKMSNPGRSS